MKKYLLLTVTGFLLLYQQTNAQPYAIGHRSVNFRDNTRSGGFAISGAPYWPATGTGRDIGCEVYYPATSSGDNTPFVNDSFPVVIFGHGFQMTWDSYKMFYDTLASLGYVVILPRTEGGLFPNHADFAKDLIWVTNRFLALDDSISSPYYNKLVRRTAMGGHSMGGGCVVASAALSNPATCYFTWAAANTNNTPNSIASAKFMTKPYLGFAGAYDCIAPYATNQKPMYDSSASPCKFMINITGASHCQFGNGNLQCNFGESTSGCASPPISRNEQMRRVYTYLLPFLRYYLKKDCAGYTSLDSAYNAAVVGGSGTLTNKFRSCVQTVPTNPAISGALSFCAGNSTTLTASPAAFTYQWSNAATTPTINVNTAGSYGLSVSNGVCITAAASVNVSQLSAPASPTSIAVADTVCAGSNVNISTPSVPTATSYIWALPTGWNQTSGDTTNTIAATASISGGAISVSAKNVCGTSNPFSKNVVVHQNIVAPTSISGNTIICTGSTGNIYSVAAISNARNYLWTVPTGWSITSGSGTNSITVTAGIVAGSISLQVVGPCDTTPPISIPISLNSPPATPGAISGLQTVCTNATNLQYSIATVPTANSYFWAVPSGWSLTSANGDSSITVAAGSVSGNITVYATNACGTSGNATLSITTNSPPSAPTTIIVSDTLCPNVTNINVTASPVSGATQYNWTLPSGWQQTAGGNSNAITLSTGANPGNISISAQNTCGTSSPTTKTIALHAAIAAAGNITGNNNVCANATGITYSILAVPNAIGYLWSVPSGWAITSGNYSTSITVTVGTAGGNVSVRSIGACDTAAATTLAVVVNSAPSAPANLSGPQHVCSNANGIIYSTNLVSGATNYNWVLPSGWSITSGSGTNSIIASASATGGIVSVSATNICGSSAAATLNVSVTTTPPAPTSISIADSICPSSGSISISTPNLGAASYNWTLPSGWMQTGGGTSNTISAMYGATGGTISVSATSSCGTSAAYTKHVFVRSNLMAPTIITGNTTICAHAPNETYSVSAVANAINYHWSVPSGWVILSGQGTNSIITNAGASGGVVSVVVYGICDTTPALVRNVTVNSAPVALSGISGSANVCSGSTHLTYSVLPANNGTYNWTLPTGWIITAGSGTNSITATAGNEGGTISVTSSNNCGTSASSDLAVSITNVPNAPAYIIAPDTICGNASNVTVVAQPVAGADDYTWSFPMGFTIVSGANTSNVVVDAGNVGGTISVTANNLCGTSIAAQKDITVRALASLTGVIAARDTICQGELLTLVAPVAANATTYNWNLSPGWTALSGSLTNQITVNASNSGNASVVALNSCGATSPALSKNVVVSDTPKVSITQIGNLLTVSSVALTYQWYYNGQAISGAIQTSHTATANGDYSVVATDKNGCSGRASATVNNVGIGYTGYMNLLVFPNPMQDVLQIMCDEQLTQIQLTNATGQLIMLSNVDNTIARITTADLPSGIYFLKINSAHGVAVKQLVKE